MLHHSNFLKTLRQKKRKRNSVFDPCSTKPCQQNLWFAFEIICKSLISIHEIALTVNVSARELSQTISSCSRVTLRALSFILKTIEEAHCYENEVIFKSHSWQSREKMYRQSIVLHCVAERVISTNENGESLRILIPTWKTQEKPNFLLLNQFLVVALFMAYLLTISITFYIDYGESKSLFSFRIFEVSFFMSFCISWGCKSEVTIGAAVLFKPSVDYFMSLQKARCCGFVVTLSTGEWLITSVASFMLLQRRLCPKLLITKRATVWFIASVSFRMGM